MSAGAFVQLHLDVCTPEGKTWCAEVTGRDRSAPGGLARDFMRIIERNTSRSGATGTYTYELGDGVYESNEGRRRLGRRFWIVADGKIRETDRAGALAHLEGANGEEATE